MAGRLFDPDRLTPRTPADPPATAHGDGDRPLTVSDLAARIQGVLRSGLGGKLRVVGEVSGFRERTHWYFDLKDEASVVNAVMFASAARKAGVRLENGVEVLAEGRVDFYAPSGRVSFIVERLRPVGAGALELRLRALMEELRKLGWFDPAGKRPLPAFPRRVAVITSRSGAALQDVIDTARRRCPAVDLLVVDARMQGASAAPEVAAAIRGLSSDADVLGIDAIIVTRGGGSMEDLWAFNERIVAEAIRACDVPIVAAIGHETDTTIAELVADERCATPTQAAMRLIPDRADLERQIDAMRRRLRSGLSQRVVGERRWLEGVERRPALADPLRIVSDRRERCDRLAAALPEALRRRFGAELRRIDAIDVRLQRRRPVAEQARRAERLRSLTADLARAVRGAHESRVRELDALERELAVVGPMAVLQRGFAVVTLGDGGVVRSTGEVKPGDSITTRVADGSFRSVVGDADQIASQQGGRPASPAMLPPRRRRRRAPDDRDQLDLFRRPG